MPEDDFMCFLLKKREAVKSPKARTWCCCAYSDAPCEHETGTCIVTIQYGDEDETCLVYQSDVHRREHVSR